MARSVEGIEMKDLKSLVDDGKKQLGSGVVAIVGVTEEGKAGVVVGVTSDLTSRYNAVDLVRVASEALGGKGGGGRPDMAQAGGPDGAKASAALDRPSKRRWPAPNGNKRDRVDRSSGRRCAVPDRSGALSGRSEINPYVSRRGIACPRISAADCRCRLGAPSLKNSGRYRSRGRPGSSGAPSAS